MDKFTKAFTSLRGEITRVIRGSEYLFSYIFLEYPKGLNFSLRNKSYGISLSGSHGYALTSKKALKNILLNIPFHDKSFLDIGSGKGGPIVYARQLGCKLSAGIEYEHNLHLIAEKNIKILGMDANCTSYNVDARKFYSYADFDIYFMFNPFDDHIYEQTINQIVNQIVTQKSLKFLICYGGANIKSVVNSGYFELLKEAKCPYRKNSFSIFKTRAKFL
jgi:16S rRNA G966 N2-methylase RsmD